MEQVCADLPSFSIFAALSSAGCLVLAFLAQLVEQLIRNEQVAGSSPVEGSVAD